MKGCREMIEHFTRLAAEPAHRDLKLVLVGSRRMELPNHPGILSLGFVEQSERDAALEAASALVMPSPFESLSMVTLEASAAGKPVLVNRDCEVLARYVDQARAGLAYSDYPGFKAAVEALLGRPEEAAAMGKRGAAYVAAHYGWGPVLDTYEELLASVAAGASRE